MRCICVKSYKKISLGEYVDIIYYDEKDNWIIHDNKGKYICVIEENKIYDFFINALIRPDELKEGIIYYKYSRMFKAEQILYISWHNSTWYNKKTYGFINANTHEKFRLFEDELALLNNLNELKLALNALLYSEFHKRTDEIRTRFINDCMGDLFSNIDFSKTK